jgi:hypothetical protein
MAQQMQYITTNNNNKSKNNKNIIIRIIKNNGLDRGSLIPFNLSVI